MKKSILTLSALALTVSLSANAQEAGDVQVSGSIAPTPCTIVVDNSNLVAPQVFINDNNGGLVRHAAESFQENAFTITISCSDDEQLYELRTLASAAPGTFDPSQNITGEGFFDSMSAGSVTSGDIAYPLLNANNEQAGYAFLAFRNVNLNPRLRIGANNNVAVRQDTNEWYPLFHRNNNNIANQFTHQLGRDDVLNMGVVWSFDDDFLDNTNVNTLIGQVSIEILYL